MGPSSHSKMTCTLSSFAVIILVWGHPFSVLSASQDIDFEVMEIPSVIPWPHCSNSPYGKWWMLCIIEHYCADGAKALKGDQWNGSISIKVSRLLVFLKKINSGENEFTLDGFFSAFLMLKSK